jgi:hypothetical protein
MAFRSGIGALLGWWLARGMIEADAAAANILEQQLAHNAQRMQVLEAALLRLLDALDSAKVAATLLKGAHTSRIYFPGPEARPAADIDVLVEPSEFQHAATVLRAAGLVEIRRTRHPARSEWVERDSPRVVRSLESEDPGNPWSIDLHWSLERWYFRGLRAGFDPSFWKTVPLAVGERVTRGLAQPLLTPFLALPTGHGMVELRLIRLVELVLVARRDVANGTLAWSDVAQLLDETGTGRFVYPTLAQDERLAPGTVDGGLLARLARASTARTRRVIEQFSAAGMHLPARSIDERLMWARGFVEVLGNIGDVLWPSDDALNPRGIARLYLRRWHLVTTGRVRWRARSGGLNSG